MFDCCEHCLEEHELDEIGNHDTECWMCQTELTIQYSCCDHCPCYNSYGPDPDHVTHYTSCIQGCHL